MNPFFFGKSNESLYGVYHPSADPISLKAVVLCYPIGQEAMRCHRAFRQLAVLLSQNSFHVLRFDYRGTGDSAHSMQDVSVSDWVDDIHMAVDELKDMSGANRIHIVSLRVASLFAALASSQRDDVENLILWDPMNSGSEFFSELNDKIQLSEALGEKPEKRGNFFDADNTLHFNGFSLPHLFQAELKEINIFDLNLSQVKKITQIVSHESGTFQMLKTQLTKHASFDYKHVPAPHDWSYVDQLGGILLPQAIIQAIAQGMR